MIYDIVIDEHNDDKYDGDDDDYDSILYCLETRSWSFIMEIDSLEGTYTYHDDFWCGKGFAYICYTYKIVSLFI